MASEPYCAEAPSLSNSILFIAEIGIAFKSVPEFPLPLVPYKFIKDALCLLFPLIKTNVWSGPKPLIVAGSIWSAPSAPDCFVALKEGIAYCKN